MTRSLRLVAPLRPPNLRSWSCQAKALASSSRLLRKAVGAWSKVAVQIAKSSARPTVLSSESLGIAGCLMFLPPPGTTQARFSPKVQSQKSPLGDSQKGARSRAGLRDSRGPRVGQLRYPEQREQRSNSPCANPGAHNQPPVRFRPSDAHTQSAVPALS